MKTTITALDTITMQTTTVETHSTEETLGKIRRMQKGYTYCRMSVQVEGGIADKFRRTGTTWERV
jgi:hypothetical protein